MKPDVDQVLQILAGHLMAEIAPSLESDYAQRSAQLVGILLTTAAEEWDRAAERRCQENRALRELFADAAPQVSDAGLRARLEAAAASEESSLRIADLERANDALRGLLIELHGEVESLDTAEAHRIEDRIWQELRLSTERRRLAMHPF
jgi:divalent metal cation (Fe/Co/Zn/Cd) transporter